MKKVVSLMLVLVLVLGMATVSFAATAEIIDRNAYNTYEATFGAAADADPVVVQKANNVYSTITFAGLGGSGLLHDIDASLATLTTDFETDEAARLLTAMSAKDNNIDNTVIAVAADAAYALKNGNVGITDAEWSLNKISVKHVVTKGSAAIKNVYVDWASDVVVEGKFDVTTPKVNSAGKMLDSSGAVTNVPANAAVDIKTVTKEISKFDYTYDGASYKNRSLKSNPRLVVEYNDEFANNNPDGIDYEVKAYIVVNGRNWPDSGTVISGKYKNDKQQYPIAADDSDVYIGDGTIAEAGDYNKSVEFHIGKNDNDNISIFSKVFKNRKYWALGSSAGGDDAMYEKYSTLLGAYSVRTVGFVGSDVQVQFKDLDKGIYVYGEVDGDLTYLGTGDQKLPYYTSYYYSDVMLDLASDEEPIEEDGEEFGDDFEVPGETGGDDFYPENVNDNPGTGC